MIDRNRRGIRKVGMRARLAIAAAVLVGGGAAGVVALSTHGGTAAAQSAGFSTSSSHHTLGEAVALSAALSSWNQSSTSSWNSSWNHSYTQSLSTLAQMSPMRTFGQVWHRHVMFAAQRGFVVLATKKFLLVQSFNGSLHLWFLNGRTRIQDVSSNATGMTAMTGSQWASNAAMSYGNMTPATNVMAGSVSTVSRLMTPVVKPTTIVVATGNQVITIVIVNTTATTTTAVTPTQTTSFTQPVFTSTRRVQRGDLVFVAGVRKNGQLKAQLVLFAAPLGNMPNSTSFGSSTSTPSTGSTFSGSHS